MHDGDRLRFGDYEFVVSIDGHSDFSPDASGQMPAPMRAQRNAAPPPTARRAVGHAYDQSRYGKDLGADLDIKDLLGESEEAVSEPTLPGYHVEESVAGESIPTLTATKDVQTSLLDDALAESLPLGDGPGKVSDDWHMSTRRIAKRDPASTSTSTLQSSPVQPAQQIRESERSRRSTSATDFTSDPSAVEAFCRGAGIEVTSIPADAHGPLLTLAGQMLREVVLSLMENLKARADQKDRFRISKTGIQPNNNNPLKFSASIEEALRKLLDARSMRYLGPVEALRDAFTDLKNHQLAVDAAMQAALDDLLFRLEPSELQERFDRGLKRNPLLGVVNKTKYWELYSEFYTLLNQRDTRGLPAVFTEEFTRIYAEKIAELENSKKK
jgi:type VI secretion system protein